MKLFCIDSEGELQLDPRLAPAELGPVYYCYRRPKHQQARTLVFINGLSYSTVQWRRLVTPFAASGDGLLFFDFPGQGKSLESFMQKEHRRFELHPTVGCQAQVLRSVVEAFQKETGVRGSLIAIALSYGGGIALHCLAEHSGYFEKAFLIAPYTMRIDHSFLPMRHWDFGLQTMRSFVPGFRQLEGAYQQSLYMYMDHRFHKEIPDSNRRHAAIQMSFGIMSYNVFFELHKLRNTEIHLAYGLKDSLVPHRLFEDLWRRLPESVLGSFLKVPEGQHILTQSSPDDLQLWIQDGLRGPTPPEFQNNETSGQMQTS